MPTKRIVSAGLLSSALLSSALVLAACGSGKAPPASGPAGLASSAKSLVLDVGDQQQSLETLLKSSGALEGAPYKVNFIQFGSGPLVDAGFAAGRIDVGFMGDTPAALAASSGLPVKAVAVGRRVGAFLYLVARPGITSVAQLRGRNVAYTTGTAEQAIALRALAAAGLTQSDVHQVNVALVQLGTVMEAGAADASVVSIQQLIDYRRDHPGAQVLATSDSLKPPSYTYVLATDRALGDAAKASAITDFTRRLVAATAWQKSHPTQWVSDYYVAVQHQTTTVANQILAAGGESTYVPIDAAVETALQNVVDLLTQGHAIPTAFSVARIYEPAATSRYNAVLAASRG